MLMVKSFVARFYFHEVLSVCFEIEDKPYCGTLGPTLNVGLKIRVQIE